MFLLGLLGTGTSGGLPEPWNFLVNYGILGLLVIALGTGKFIVLRRELDTANTTADNLRIERDAERKSYAELEQLVRDKYVPALEAAKTTQEETLKFLQKATSQ